MKNIFVVLLIAVAAAFGFAMWYFDESLPHVWKRVVDYFEERLQSKPVPTPTPSPTPAPTPTPKPVATPTAVPDPISWLREHKDNWPKKLTLAQPANVPAVFKGKVVGAIKLPVGTVVEVRAIAEEGVTIMHNGGGASVPIGATNLAALARTELDKTEITPAIASTTPPRVEVAKLPASEQAATNLVDTIVMGDQNSETQHDLQAAFPPVMEIKDRTVSEPSEPSESAPSDVVKGGLNEKARRLLPRMPNPDMYGGELNFDMKVDPVNQNYFTIKLWGSDSCADGALILNCENFEIGKRHGNSAADLFVNHGGAWFPNRFWYRTTALPLKLTKGKTSVRFKLRSAGKIYDYNNKPGKSYIPDYQHLMKDPSWQIYRVYTHLGGYLETAGEAQGAVFIPARRTTPGAEVINAWKERVSGKVRGMLKSGLIGGGNIPAACRDIGYLAQCYDISWTPGYHRNEVIAAAIKSIDRIVSLYAADNSVAGGEWGGAFGPMGEAIWRLSPAMKNRMSETLDFGGSIGQVTRQQGWSKALRASVDAGRLHRRSITNQETICAENIYTANKGLQIIDPANALKESEALRYPYEAAGLSPFLGDDQPGGGPIPVRGTAKDNKLWFGPNWYHVTTRGTTKEPSFVGSDYGEMAAGVYRMGRMAGDRKLLDQALKMVRARAYFRFPGVDSEGFMVMTAAEPIGTRNNSLPGHDVYLTRDVSNTGASIVAHEDALDLRGWFQQQLADGQLYAMSGADNGNKAGGLGAAFFPDDYAASMAKAKSGLKMPTAPGAPDFAWGDEENMVVAARHRDDFFFTNMVWRGNVAINKAAVIFNLGPLNAYRAEVQLDDIRYVPTGKYQTQDDSVDSFANKNPPDNKLYPNAELDNKYPIAMRPGLGEAPEKNQDGGRGTGYTLSYGHWLVGMNGNYTTGNYRMKLPPGFKSAHDLVSGKVITAPVVIPRGTTVVFYLPQPAAIPKSPDSTIESVGK